MRTKERIGRVSDEDSLVGRADSITDLIGNTPIVRLQHVVGGNDATVWAKLEKQNPGGSIKDRIARAMIQAAQESGLLKPGE